VVDLMVEESLGRLLMEAVDKKWPPISKARQTSDAILELGFPTYTMPGTVKDPFSKKVTKAVTPASKKIAKVFAPPGIESSHNYIVVVSEIVTGKSKGPTGRGFYRYKPFPYRDSSQPHTIMYAARFPNMTKRDMELSSKKLVSEVSKLVGAFNRGRPPSQGGGNISSYEICVHNIDTDQNLVMSGTGNFALSPGGFQAVNNFILRKWKILK